MRIILSSILLTLALTGCASGGAPGRGGGRDPNLINNEELRQAESEGISAFQLIERLRSRWLQTRGTTSISNPAGSYAMVVLDGVPWGELNVLSNMTIIGNEEIRFLNARDATTRFGTGYDGGAILVVSRGRGGVRGPRTARSGRASGLPRARLRFSLANAFA